MTLYIFVKGSAEEEFIEVAEGISIELNEDKEILRDGDDIFAIK
jgi:uncharacterized protein YuzE